jgi:alpha-N-arabinofuranosidase
MPDQAAREWAEAPRLLEDVYSVTDAVVVGSLLIALLRHADRVRVACLAQLVNVIAPIMTEPGGPAWRQATFYPFALTSRYGRGTVLTAEPESPVLRTAGHGDVPAVQATAVLRDNQEIAVFAVNRDRTAAVELLVEFRGVRPAAVLEHRVVADPDEDAVNTAAQPDRVTPVTRDGGPVTDGTARVVLPPMSWNVIRFA